MATDAKRIDVLEMNPVNPTSLSRFQTSADPAW